MAEFAAQLTASKCDVIFAQGPQATLAAMKAASPTPIVFVGIGDPVANGIVASLARPGANVTGLTNLAGDLRRKRLELLKEGAPQVSYVAVFWNGITQGGNPGVLKDSETAARALKLTLHPLRVSMIEDFDGAFQAAIKARADALMTIPDPFINAHVGRLVEFTARNRLPSIYSSTEFIDAGGLMSYGPNLVYQYR